ADADPGAHAQTGLGTCAPRRGQAGASVLSHQGWQEAAGGGAAILGRCTVPAAKRAGGGQLGRYETGSLPDDHGGFGGVKLLVTRYMHIHLTRERKDTEKRSFRYETLHLCFDGFLAYFSLCGSV